MTLTEKRMEKLNRLYTKCRTNMEQIGIEVGNVCGLEIVGINQRAGGYCVQQENGFVIQISNIYLDDCPDEIGECVMYHELIHTVSGCFDHSEKFLKTAKQIREKYHTLNDLISNQSPSDNGYIIKRSKWAYRCNTCGWLQVRTNTKGPETHSVYACPHCGVNSILEPILGKDFEQLKENTNRNYFNNRNMKD